MTRCSAGLWAGLTVLAGAVDDEDLVITTSTGLGARKLAT
jgi:hypothetical protein